MPLHTLLSPGRLVAAYRKTHLCDVELEGRVSMKESGFTNPGTEIVAPVSTPAGKVRHRRVPMSPPVSHHRVLTPVPPSPCHQLGLSICYDLRFPELSLALQRAGAEILTYPSAFTMPTGSAHWEVSPDPPGTNPAATMRIKPPF